MELKELDALEISGAEPGPTPEEEGTSEEELGLSEAEESTDEVTDPRESYCDTFPPPSLRFVTFSTPKKMSQSGRWRSQGEQSWKSSSSAGVICFSIFEQYVPYRAHHLPVSRYM